MRSLLLVTVLVALAGCGDLEGLKTSFQLKELSPSDAVALAGMTFDGGAITVQGRVSTLLFAEPATMGMMVVHADGGTERLAFSTAATRDLAKQGFTRFSVSPGQEVVVKGTLAKNGEKIAGYTAARADVISSANGKTLFDRGAF